MRKFRKITAIEPILLTPRWEDELKKHAESVRHFPDTPKENDEIIKRIADSDAVLLSHTAAMDREVIEACPDIRYIGMCCSLYTPESANVDIAAARKKGIEVCGVRDYGDEGVAEYVVSELARLLHGFGEAMWREYPMELTGVNVGVIGMGTTGAIVSRALRFFGAHAFYYSRTRKPALERSEGYRYLPLEELLGKCDIVCTCLHKNVIVLDKPEFAILGEGKIIVNISIGPSFSLPAMEKWLENPNNYLLSDTFGGIGVATRTANVISPNKSAGRTTLARDRLGKKVLDNIVNFLGA